MDSAERIVQRHIEAAEGEPMIYGKSDCAMWSAAILRDIHGVDLARGWRKRYGSKKGADRTLRGYAGLLVPVQRATGRAGWLPKDSADAQPGDLGLMTTVSGPACVVCYRATSHARWWVGRIDRGVAFTTAAPEYVWGSLCRP